MPLIHNEASGTRFGFGLFIAAALMLVLVMVATNFGHTGLSTNAMWIAGP
jgi:hypothetical protein